MPSRRNSPQDRIKEQLIRLATKARRQAYAPYSRYRVGAALLAGSGKVYTGANVENSSYGLTVCAERNAIWQAIQAGEREVLAIAVVTANGGSPCGACRQVLGDFAADDADVWACDPKGAKLQHWSVDQLLPDRFGPQNLE